MKSEWLYFVAGAVLSWGFYVPVLHEGQRLLGGALRAFLCVGAAYFLTAVLIPLVLMYFDLAGSRQGIFNQQGVTFATLGGIAGAAGALTSFTVESLGCEKTTWVLWIAFGRLQRDEPRITRINTDKGNPGPFLSVLIRVIRGEKRTYHAIRARGPNHRRQPRHRPRHLR